MNKLDKPNREWIEEISSLKEKISKLEKKESDLVREQEALRKSEEKYRILLAQSPDPTFSFTPEGQYTFVNKAFALGVGKPVENIIGKTIWDVFPKEEADMRFVPLSQVNWSPGKNCPNHPLPFLCRNTSAGMNLFW